MQSSGGQSGAEESLLSAVQHNPAVPDDRSKLQPHGEKLKRGPNVPEYNPNVELVDVSTDQLREHTLAEAVERDRPVLDDQQGTPFHTTDKGQHASTHAGEQQQQQQLGSGVHGVTGALEGGGHGL